MAQQSAEDIQFRALEDLRNFTIDANDGEIGRIKDLVFSPSDWVIRYMVVDTGNWLVGKKVLLSREWIQRIDWEKKHVSVSITKAQVKESPTLDAVNKLDRDFEERIYTYYQRPHYWIEDSKVDEASWESFPASDPPATHSVA
ncbi:MAG: PRC-barrel domain-containing protein [Caldilineaceae bacterium]